VWSLVGPLSAKDKTQLEERLRRVAGPSSPIKTDAVTNPPQMTRLAAATRPDSPSSTSRSRGIPRPASPSVTGISKLARPSSPGLGLRSASPIPVKPNSPVRASKVLVTSGVVPPSPTAIGRPKSMLPSRLQRPRSNVSHLSSNPAIRDDPAVNDPATSQPQEVQRGVVEESRIDDLHNTRRDAPDDITVTISSILSSDPSRSVDALKKIQKILAIGPDAGPKSPQYRELAEHTEGLIETITLQMAHIFDRPDNLVPGDNFRLAKHLIQTLNNFCDHSLLAESLTVDILTSLLEELTLRLLETDDSQVKEVKDLSRFINMIILRLFATGRRMSIFR
jgi:cytoskeleton-associated protein 5